MCKNFRCILTRDLQNIGILNHISQNKARYTALSGSKNIAGASKLQIRTGYRKAVSCLFADFSTAAGNPDPSCCLTDNNIPDAFLFRPGPAADESVRVRSGAHHI